MKFKRYSFFLFTAICFLRANSQSIITNKGSLISLNGSNIYIKGDYNNAAANAQLLNTGSEFHITGNIMNNTANNLFAGDLGKTVLDGNSKQYINGDSISFYQLTINNTYDTSLILNSSIKINSQLILNDGSILLNRNNIDLGGSGTLIGENDTSKIFGDSGYIQATTYINNINIDSNLAGLGLHLGTTDNLDNTFIQRGHKKQNVSNGSIYRYYKLYPTIPGIIDSIKVDYLSSEIDTLNESDLGIWAFLTAPWKKMPGSQIDVSNNFASAGNYTLDSSIITISELTCDIIPIINLGDTNILCTNDTIILDAGIPNIWYLWSNNDTTQTTAIHISGIYTIAVTNYSGCTGYDSTLIVNKPIPYSTFTADTVCQNTETVFLNLSTISEGSLSYLWNFGDTLINTDTSSLINPVYSYDTFGIYTVVLTSISDYGCKKDTSVLVRVNANPIPNFAYQYLCNTTALSFSDSSFSADNALMNYSWNFGDSQFSISENPSHNYSDTGNYLIQLKTTTEYGCTDSILSSIYLYPIPSIDFGPQLSTCIDSLVLNAENFGADYLWKNGDTTQTYTVTSDSIYWVTITGQNGCVVSDTVAVYLNVQVQPLLGDDSSICGNTILDAGYPGSKYVWSTGDTLRYINVTNDGNYWVEVTDQNNCIGYDTISLIIFETPTIDLGSDSVICNNIPLLLDAANPGSNYLWSTGATGQSIIVDSTGIYYVKVTDLNNCTHSDTLFVYSEYYQIDLGQDKAICEGGQLTLDAGEGSSYNWITNSGILSTERYYSVTQAGTFWLNAISLLGCTSSDTINVTFSSDLVTASFLIASDVNVGDTVQFIQLSYPTPIYSYFWDFKDNTISSEEAPQHIFLQGGKYNVTLIVNNEICEDTLVKQIIVEDGSGKQDFPDPEDNYKNLFTELLNIQLYPNPNEGRFNLSIQLNKRDNILLQWFDMAGRNILRKNYFTDQVDELFDCSNWNNGLYELYVVAGKDSETIKIIKIK